MIGQPCWILGFPKIGKTTDLQTLILFSSLSKIFVLPELWCILTMDRISSIFDQMPWPFRFSSMDFLAPVLLSEVSYFLKMFWVDSKSTKEKILSSWFLYFVPVVKVFDNFGFVEHLSDDFCWSPSDFDCSPLNLWLSELSANWNSYWRFHSDLGWFWASFHVTINIS